MSIYTEDIKMEPHSTQFEFQDLVSLAGAGCFGPCLGNSSN